MSAEDSAWMTSGDRALVLWPPSERPLYAIARVRLDLSGGVLSSEARVVSAFQRRWTFPADSVRGIRVIARWADGEAAAVEKKMGAGCVRSVAIRLPVAAGLPAAARSRRATILPLHWLHGFSELRSRLQSASCLPEGSPVEVLWMMQ
jgi:hypothetical protein